MRKGRMIEEPTAVETTSRPDSGGTLVVEAAASLLVLVTFTTPLTTLVSTAAGLDTGPGAQAWVLSAMPVGAAAGLLSSGAIGDDYGWRRTFLTGTLLLAGSSVLGALAGSGANNTTRYVGTAIGITIVAVLLTRSGAAPGATGVLSGWNISVLLTVGFSLVGALVVLLARERTAKQEPFLERRF